MATESPQATLTRRFDEPSCDDVMYAGREGASLGDLTRAGFPVPPGFVVGAPAAAESPAGIEPAIAGAYRELGDDVAVEVRRSPVVPDSTVAPIVARGAKQVLAAVRRCVASHEKAAILVQRRIAAVQAGVMFTVDTAAQNPDHIIIECRAESPVRYVVDKLLLRIVASDREPVIDKREARRVADLGRSIEHHYRAPQEIEWALDERDRLWLLRTRPLTQTGPAA